jgi:hypothetical protein
MITDFLADDDIDIKKVTAKLSGLDTVAPILPGEEVEARRRMK